MLGLPHGVPNGFPSVAHTVCSHMFDVLVAMPDLLDMGEAPSWLGGGHTSAVLSSVISVFEGVFLAGDKDDSLW